MARIGSRNALPPSQSRISAVNGRALALMRCPSGAPCSCRALQALERFMDLSAAAFRLGALLALLVDHLFRCARHEVGVLELLVDAVDVVGDLLQFLLQAGALGGEI